MNIFLIKTKCFLTKGIVNSVFDGIVFFQSELIVNRILIVSINKICSIIKKIRYIIIIIIMIIIYGNNKLADHTWYKTRKFLTMYKMHHPKSDVDRLYLPRT